ncbi:MAG: hypothetical protein D6741_07670 [Planctomycetota bacterium]|nr:MAG: hypothetical protein D6741_07670 [Planctomycetota bacterium]
MSATHVIHSAQRWEYLTLTRKSEQFLVNDLNVHGQEGWELVSASYYKDMKGAMVWTAFLKRPCGAKKVAPTKDTAADRESSASRVIQPPKDGAGIDEYNVAAPDSES